MQNGIIEGETHIALLCSFMTGYLLPYTQIPPKTQMNYQGLILLYFNKQEPILFMYQKS